MRRFMMAAFCRVQSHARGGSAPPCSRRNIESAGGRRPPGTAPAAAKEPVETEAKSATKGPAVRARPRRGRPGFRSV